jgi:hypothetical protein
MEDTPFFTTPAGAKTPSVDESFTDYLMFQSRIQGSVWIALSQLTWSCSASTQADQPTAHGALTTSSATEPSGSACFPPWANTAVNLISEGPVEEG